MATTAPKINSQAGSIVTVIIPVDKHGEVEREPAPFTIFKSLHQQVLWQASDGKAQFNVEFKRTRHSTTLSSATLSLTPGWSGAKSLEIRAGTISIQCERQTRASIPAAL